MSKKSIAILCLTALYSILFYQQNVGINFVIFTVAAVALFFYQDKAAFKIKAVLLMCFGAIFSSIFAFVHNSNLSMWTTIVALFLLPGVIINRRSSILIDFVCSLYSSLVAPAYMIIDAVENSKNNKNKGNGFLRMLKYLVPIVFVITFFFIYRAMNPLFEKYTRDIADIISIGWVFFTLSGLVLVYAFYKQQRSKKVDVWEKNWKLNLTKEDVVKPKWSEGVAFTLLFIVLNLMLVVVNVMDINYLYLGEGMPDGITHKEFVHKGVGMLILSIVLGISILLYFFRGFLNFSKQKNALKVLAFLWVLQNVFMVVSTTIRNTMYVDAALLTYKRIGVYFWLFFALLGLIMFFIKLYKDKSVWYLARYNFTILYIVLIASSAFDWDMIISNFNISRAKQMEEISSLDKNYLLSISEGNIKDLYSLKDIEGFEVDSAYSYQGYLTYHQTNTNGLDAKTYRFLLNDMNGDWRSASIRRNRVREDIKQLDENGDLANMDLSNSYLKSIKPLKSLTKLQTLNLSNNNFNLKLQVLELSELNEIKTLHKLNLSNNYIYNLDSLKPNSNIEKLNLADNQLKSLRFLNNFPNLDSLDMSRNQLVSLNTLPKCDKLVTLNLRGNPLNDIGKLNQLKNLEVLNLSGINQNVWQLPKMNNLVELRMSGSQKLVKNLNQNDVMYKRLQLLDISQNNLGSLAVLLHKDSTIAPNLSSLIVSSNKIMGLYGIDRFKELTYLDLAYNQVYSLKELENLVQLKNLYLNNNAIADITSIANFTQLEDLDLSNNTIENFSALKNLSNLNRLILANTGIKNLSDINSNAPLTELGLQSCRIVDWESIGSFKSLETISVSYLNELDVKNFKSLKKLKRIYVSNTDEEIIQLLKSELVGVEVI